MRNTKRQANYCAKIHFQFRLLFKQLPINIHIIELTSFQELSMASLSDIANSTSNFSDGSEFTNSLAYNLFHFFWRITFLLAMISGFFGNIFIIINVLRDPQMRNTNFFFVLNLVFVDLFVIISFVTVREVALALQSDNLILNCFPSVWNFVVNYTASNYILLFLCYEKFILILLPFEKAKYLRLVEL